MPWTPTEFASRHNHSLHGERAEHASRIANAVLRRGTPEGESIAIANKWAKNHRATGGPAPQAPTYQNSSVGGDHLANINSQGFIPVPQSGTINLDLSSGALTPGSNAALQGIAQRGLPIQGPPPPAPAVPTGGGVPGMGPPPPSTGGGAPGGPAWTDAQSQAWNQQWGVGGGGGGTASGGRIPRRANGGLSPSMEFPSWSRMQARGEDDTHPSGLIPGAGGGRQDNVAMNLAPHSHVIPADVVSGFGGGNSAAGAANIEHAIHSGPFGTGLPKVPMHAPRMAAPRMPRLARGGNAKGVRTLVSSGEYIVHPDDVHRIGNGDYDKGHDLLDKFIVHSRKQIIAHQRKLPGPVKE